jgi:hypothetical protein
MSRGFLVVDPAALDQGNGAGNDGSLPGANAVHQTGKIGGGRLAAQRHKLALMRSSPIMLSGMRAQSWTSPLKIET